MKVQCDVCEKAEARVMCCADEAALCADCDSKVHAANKLAGKHQRVNLLYPKPDDLPSCDVCQDKAGYFFCLEDRALLCRSCDYSIHSTNALAAKHKRFLVSGTRVALYASVAQNEGQRMVPSSSPIPQQSPSLTGEKRNTYEQTEICGISAASLESKHSKQQVMPVAASTEEVMVVIPSNLASVPVNPYNHQVHFNADWEMPPSIGGVHANSMNVGGAIASQQGGGGFLRRNSISEYLTETIPGWRVDELLSLTDAMSTRTFSDCSSSKTNVWSYGDADWQADYNLEDMMSGQGPAEVPSIPSPPTFSGIPRSLKTLGLGKHVKPSDLDCLFEYNNVPVVPDIGGVTSPSAHSLTTLQPQKRQRTALDF